MINVPPAATEKIIIALDVPTEAAAKNLINELSPPISFYKLGHELSAAGCAVPLAKELKARGAQIFLDYKLYDTPRTVQRAVQQLCALDADFISVVATRQIMTAAAASAPPGTKILAVPMLTSWTPDDFSAEIRAHGIEGYLKAQAAAALKCGCAGIILPAPYVSALRQAYGPEIILVTPGIQKAAPLLGQAITGTLAEVLAAGADYAVLGRVITAAGCPSTALTEELATIKLP